MANSAGTTSETSRTVQPNVLAFLISISYFQFSTNPTANQASSASVLPLIIP